MEEDKRLKVWAAMSEEDLACKFLSFSEDGAAWVPENGAISLADGMKDFTIYAVDRHKLVSFVKLDNDFIHDVSFDLCRACYVASRQPG